MLSLNVQRVISEDEWQFRALAELALECLETLQRAGAVLAEADLKIRVGSGPDEGQARHPVFAIDGLPRVRMFF